MNKVLSLSSKTSAQPVVKYHVPRTANPVYPVLLVLVLVVGAACTAAWFLRECGLEARAQKGDAQAQYLLGKRYFDTAVSMGDYARAAGLIKKSAEQGYAKAETALGLLYKNGLGVTRSYEQAMKWMRRAAEQGNAVAQNELGVMYAKGHGAPKNLDEAAKWCQMAAAQGSKVAEKNVIMAEAGKGSKIQQLTTARQSYENVALQKIEADGLTVSFSPVRGGVGVAKLKLENLPEQLKELCGRATKQELNTESPYSQLTSVAPAL